MKLQKGFSLIELMVVVAIVAILTSVAVPAYQDYVIRGKLMEAISTLSDLRIRMEQYYQDNKNYGSTSTTCGLAMPGSPQVQYFAYSCNWGAAGSDNTTYTVTATGNGTLANFSYTIDQSNNKRTTGLNPGWGTASPGSPALCWITKKGGTC